MVNQESCEKAYVKIRTENGLPETSKVIVVIDGREYEVENVQSIDWEVTLEPGIGYATVRFVLYKE